LANWTLEINDIDIPQQTKKVHQLTKGGGGDKPHKKTPQEQHNTIK